MSLRSPLAVARNHGSAHDGVHHWWRQRLTALAMIPLILWVISALPLLASGDYDAARQWLARPLNAVMAVLLSWLVFHHARLGMQVVIEDYINPRWLEVGLQVLTRFAAMAATAAASLFILLIAVGQ